MSLTLLLTENEPAHQALPDLDEGRRSWHQPGVRQPSHHLRRVLEPRPRRPVHLQGLQVGPGFCVFESVSLGTIELHLSGWCDSISGARGSLSIHDCDGLFFNALHSTLGHIFIVLSSFGVLCG